MSTRSSQLRSSIEEEVPSAFRMVPRATSSSLPTGISEVDQITGGVPIHALTEVCGSDLASSGKTSVLLSLLAHTTQERFCALVDAKDSFDPTAAHDAGVNPSRLLWIRCGKSKSKWNRLEQAFKVTDMLLHSGGFGLIAADVSSIAENVIRKVPLSFWFRLSRVVEKQQTALVFVTQRPHASSCAALVLKFTREPTTFTGKLLTHLKTNVEVVRRRERKPVKSERRDCWIPVKAVWA